MLPPPRTKLAFSLVELSIVLVILGLLVGGVLSGKSLIRAAEIRATIAQVDSLRVAARTFREKYFSLPGDIPTADANGLGLALAPAWLTAGNGDGLITFMAHGEANLFFVHLSQKGLISGGYQAFNLNQDVSGAQISDYIMKAKYPGSFYLNVWSGGPDKTHPASTTLGTDGINYISLSQTSRYCHTNICGNWGGNALLPTVDAYVIDSKVDDGKPQSGAVQAFFLEDQNYGQWAGDEYSGRGMHTVNSPLPATTANPASSVNCYDNGGVGGVAQSYTVSLNNNTCALSFKM